MLFVKDLEQRGTCEGMEPENIKWRVSHMYSQGVGVGWGGGEQWQRDWLPINTWFINFDNTGTFLNDRNSVRGFTFYQSWETLHRLPEAWTRNSQSGWSQKISWTEFCLWNKTGFVYLGNFQSCSQSMIFISSNSHLTLPLFTFSTHNYSQITTDTPVACCLHVLNKNSSAFPK